MAELRTYEVMYIVDTGLSDDGLTQLSDNLTQIISDLGGKVTKNENMGVRQLAYPIGRRNDGHYMLLEVEGSGREIAELERRMRVNDQVIRYLTVRVDEDRQRAEKFKAKRARKAAKRGGAAAAAASAAEERGSAS